MLITFQDRVRINRPCNMGPLQVSIECILPIIVLPILLGTAAINHICLAVNTVLFPIILLVAYCICKSHIPQTRFFFSWALCSIVYLWLIFEFTVPLLELLPEENFIFRVCIFGSIFCFYWLRKNAPLSFTKMNASTTDHDESMDNNDQTRLLLEDDSSTEKSVSAPKWNKSRRQQSYRPVHCDICQQYVVNRYHHSRWLDCCISDTNVRFFLLGCGMGLFGLLFGANLALTSICHPFFLFNIFGIKILLPDDCSDVFDQYDMALSFVSSIYASTIGLCGLLVFSKQIYEILAHTSEWKRSFQLLRSYICCSRL